MLKKAVKDDPFASDETWIKPTIRGSVHHSRSGPVEGVDEENIGDSGNKHLGEDEEAQKRIAKSQRRSRKALDKHRRTSVNNESW